MRGRCRRWGWHSRLSYPTPRRFDEVHRSHLRRGLAWRMAVRAFLLAPPPWDSQVGLATCFLYTPLCSVLKLVNTTTIKLLLLLLLFLSHHASCLPFALPRRTPLPRKLTRVVRPRRSRIAPSPLYRMCVTLLTGVPRILRSRDPTMSITETDYDIDRLSTE